MFRGSSGGIVAALVIPAAQVCVLFLFLSGMVLPASAGFSFLGTMIALGEAIAALLLWIYNMILWAKFGRNQIFDPNALVSVLMPAIPPLVFGWMFGHPGRIGVFAVA